MTVIRYCPGTAVEPTINEPETKPPEIAQDDELKRGGAASEVITHVVSFALNPDPLTETKTAGPAPPETMLGEIVIWAMGLPIVKVAEAVFPLEGLPEMSVTLKT